MKGVPMSGARTAQKKENLGQLLDQYRGEAERQQARVEWLEQRVMVLAQGVREVTESTNPYDVAWRALERDCELVRKHQARAEMRAQKASDRKKMMDEAREMYRKNTEAAKGGPQE